MTDWSRLSHAYGSAEDVPALLDQLAGAPDPELWNDLWSALCHQGSVYSASFAALPWLAEMAGSDDEGRALDALTLAGAIMAGADRSHEAGEVRRKYAARVKDLLARVNQRLRTTADRADYLHLLGALLAFEGEVGWGEELVRGLVDEEYQVDCPDCRAGLYVVLGERGFFCSSEDHALADGPVETGPLRPANPADLDGIGRRLHDAALANGQYEVAHALTHAFGHASCPDCGTPFSVAERIADGNSAEGTGAAGS
ncbi:hypothetical protein [Streptomyces sp. NPDC005438]|uniref:hypothetical protein n=1 Tax=Streptomyces sp. NPDC005438 TaxID=3156880 RepID=UPI0033A26A1A